jgi:hypothetical protein
MASKRSLSASARVDSSITIRGGCPELAIACATFSTAAGVGRLVMMMGASRVTCADVIGDDDVSRRKLGPFGGVGIEADHPPSALDKVAGDRAAHDAKPDDANGLVHASSLPPVEFD